MDLYLIEAKFDLVGGGTLYCTYVLKWKQPYWASCFPFTFSKIGSALSMGLM